MAHNMAQKRGNPFSRTNSPSPSPSHVPGRPKSAIMSSPLSTSPPQHSRNQSYSIAETLSSNRNASNHHRSSSRVNSSVSNTFAPSFIKTDEMQHGREQVSSIEGEYDFSGKRYVWLKDPATAFVKGWVVEELGDGQILVQCDDGSVCFPNRIRNLQLTASTAARSQ